MLGIFREYEGERLVALFNFSEHPQKVPFDIELDYTDLFTGEKRAEKDIELKPYGFLWALVK